jgi:hypothetical protein
MVRKDTDMRRYSCSVKEFTLNGSRKVWTLININYTRHILTYNTIYARRNHGETGKNVGNAKSMLFTHK